MQAIQTYPAKHTYYNSLTIVVRTYRLDIGYAEELLMVVEGEPNTELIVGLITMVSRNASITYNDGFADMDMST